MSKPRTRQDFEQFAYAVGMPPFDAAERVLKEVKLGRKPPRWMRRAARALTRRANVS
jgi:hypothetical protein